MGGGVLILSCCTALLMVAMVPAMAMNGARSDGSDIELDPKEKQLASSQSTTRARPPRID